MDMSQKNKNFIKFLNLSRFLLSRNNDFHYQFSLNAGQKYCRMLQWEHSAILSTCIKLPNDFKAFVLSIFEWPLKTGFTVFIYD